MPLAEDPAFEHELAWGDRLIPILSAQHLDAPASGPPLPPALVSALALLERHDVRDDLDASCSAADALELVSLLSARAHELAAERHLAPPPRDLTQLPASAQVQLIAAVVASRMSYDTGLASRDLLDRVRQLAASARDVLWADPVDEARQLLRTTRSGVCRHYAAVMSTLFFALRRTSLDLPSAYLAKLAGNVESHVGLWGEHMWNLLADSERNALYAVDATWADGQHERHTLPFQLALANTSRHRHVSALLGWLGFAWSTPGSVLHHHPVVADVFAHALAPGAPRGQVLLLHLAESIVVPASAAARIARYLDVPAWRARIERVDRTTIFDDDGWAGLLERAGV